MPVPVHRLATAEDYLSVLAGHPTVFPAGERFAYNNGGYVVLALLAERASGIGYHDLVRRCVLEPAGMVDTAFLRSDELPARAARGYLAREGLRTNVLHLPVVGVGDGGAYSTAADLHRFWQALHAGRIVSRATVEQMLSRAQRLARGVPPLRARVPPARDRRRRVARGVRRRGLVHQPPRAQPGARPGPSSPTGPTAPGRSSRC